MTQLDQALGSLRRFFEPWNTAPNDTVIWKPEASDPNTEIKGEMIVKASAVIVAGGNALAGLSFRVPVFGESEFAAIEKILASDPEQGDFYELAAACRHVVHLLAEVGCARGDRTM